MLRLYINEILTPVQKFVFNKLATLKPVGILAGGTVEPDDYKIDRETLEIVEKKIGRKDKMSVVESEKTKVIKTKKELTKKQVLSDNKIKEIAQTCLKIEQIFNYPQDIEWCISDNKLCLLQSRARAEVIK